MALNSGLTIEQARAHAKKTVGMARGVGFVQKLSAP
jgi:hypothetical protein